MSLKLKVEPTGDNLTDLDVEICVVNYIFVY